MCGGATGDIRRLSSKGLFSKKPDCNASRSTDAPTSETNATIATCQSRAPTLAVGKCACSFIACPAIKSSKKYTYKVFILSSGTARIVSFRRCLRSTAELARAVEEPGAFGDSGDVEQCEQRREGAHERAGERGRRCDRERDHQRIVDDAAPMP